MKTDMKAIFEQIKYKMRTINLENIILGSTQKIVRPSADYDSNEVAVKWHVATFNENARNESYEGRALDIIYGNARFIVVYDNIEVIQINLVITDDDDTNNAIKFIKVYNVEA